MKQEHVGVQDDQILVGDYDSRGIEQGRTVKQYIEDEFDYQHDFRWAAMGILFFFVLVMRTTVAITTKTLQWQKR
jgi:hypothetical protein